MYTWAYMNYCWFSHPVASSSLSYHFLCHERDMSLWNRLASSWLLAWLILPLWSYKQYVTPKRRRDCTRLHGITFQMTMLLISSYPYCRISPHPLMLITVSQNIHWCLWSREPSRRFVCDIFQQLARNGTAVSEKYLAVCSVLPLICESWRHFGESDRNTHVSHYSQVKDILC
jgi:hypothetical protein